jgi:hypothetical protein
MTIEDEVRETLTRRVEDVRPSPDAWRRITSRIEASGEGVQRRRRVPLVAGAAAAAVAVVALVVGLGARDDTTSVATRPGSTTAEPNVPWVWPADPADAPRDPVEAAARYVQDRTGTRPTRPELTSSSTKVDTVVFRSGEIESEVHVVAAGGRWFVDSAASYSIALNDPTYDGQRFKATVTSDTAGALDLWYGSASMNANFRVGPQRVALGQVIHLDQPFVSQSWVNAAAVLHLDDGTVAISEAWATDPKAPGASPDEDRYRGVYPAVTGEELAGYEAQVRAQRRPDLEDPRAVAGQFLGETLFPRDTSPISYAVDPFRAGDATSGEVPFTLSDGNKGTVVVRRSSPAARVWYVVSAQTEPAVVKEAASGQLTFTRRGNVSVELRAVATGQSVHEDLLSVITYKAPEAPAVVIARSKDAQGRTTFSVLRAGG